MSRKLYVLVRKDLTKSQQAVQGGHALAEYLLRGPFTLWGNGMLVYLGVRNESELMEWEHRIRGGGDKPVPFFEPDLANSMTAFAVECSNDLLRTLKLL